MSRPSPAKSTASKAAPVKKPAKKAATKAAAKPAAPAAVEAPDPDVSALVPPSDELPTDDQIAAIAAIAEAQLATADTGTDGEPSTPPEGDADDAVSAVDPIEGNDDDIELPERDDKKVSNRPPRVGEGQIVGTPTIADVGHSLQSNIKVYTRRDGATLSFDKVHTSRSEIDAAIAAFNAELD